MTELQNQILQLIKDKISDANSMIIREAVTPAEISRCGTHSHNVYLKLGEAETWIRLLIEDEENK